MLSVPSAVVSGASRRAKHGAYSLVIREKMAAILDEKQGSGGPGGSREREDLLTLMESMDAVNTDNPGESLDFAIKTTMGLYASLLIRHSRGEVKFGDFLIGAQLINDSLRKLIGTKHDVLGTADDETERAVNAVLERFGLGPGQSDGPMPTAFALEEYSDSDEVEDVEEDADGDES